MTTTYFVDAADLAAADRTLKQCLVQVRGYVRDQGIDGWRATISDLLRALTINRTMVAVQEYRRATGDTETGALFVQGIPGQVQNTAAEIRVHAAMLMAAKWLAYPLGVQVADMSGTRVHEATRYTRAA